MFFWIDMKFNLFVVDVIWFEIELCEFLINNDYYFCNVCVEYWWLRILINGKIFVFKMILIFLIFINIFLIREGVLICNIYLCENCN